MMQTLNKLELQTQELKRSDCRGEKLVSFEPLQSNLLPLTSPHALSRLPTIEKFPRHIGQAFAFGLADSIRVLGIEADLAILIDDLRMQREDHVLFERNIGLRADCGILKHRHADAVAREMAECEAVLAECIGDGAMHAGGEFTVPHQLARRFHRVRIVVSHLLRSRTWLALNQCARELDPVAAGSGNFERIEKKIVAGNLAMTGHFEVSVGLSMFPREQNVHHPRPGAAREETLDRGCHDFSFGLAGLVSRNQRPETIDDDVHGIAHFDEFFFALHGARHVEFLIKGHEFERTLREFTVVADSHDEVHPKRADALPFALDGAVSQPPAGDVGPDLIFHPGLLLVTDPASFARKDKRRFVFEWDDNVHVTMNDFESGCVEDRALEPGILTAADDESVQSAGLHAGANVFVTAIDFLLAWQNDLSGYLLRTIRQRLAHKSL